MSSNIYPIFLLCRRPPSWIWPSGSHADRHVIELEQRQAALPMARSRTISLNRQLPDLHRVRYFLALCEELNFTRAARKCGVAQPSVTISIRQLEERLGGTLFERKPRVRLTQLGAAIRPHLQQIEFQASQVLEIAERYHSGQQQPEAENLIDAVTGQFTIATARASPSGGEHDDRFTA